MPSSRVFSQERWRLLGTINLSLAYFCELVLVVCFAISVSKNKFSWFLPTVIYNGDCGTSRNISLYLHLLINVLSTAILASSNFFMQVLGAPSREEIDKAHGWLRSLDIGVQSLTNLRHISWFKLISWILFFVSSIPIHIFFNSVIFQTEYLGTDWNLTIATEAFTLGAPFFPPGASLVQAGTSSLETVSDWSYEGPAYVDFVPSEEYFNASSTISNRIRYAARYSHEWDKLDAKKCQEEYNWCTPRTEYEDLVVVVDTGATRPDGWTRSEVFGFEPSSNISSIWDSRVPPSSTNSLWFSAQCKTSRDSRYSDDTCINSCWGGLGHARNSTGMRAEIQEPWILSLFDITNLSPELGFNNQFNQLHVSHCLARRSSRCKVMVANLWLLVVIASIFVKASQATFVVWKLPATSLITPGDAIESFISRQDPQTRGLCTMDIKDSQQLEYGFRDKWTYNTASQLKTKTSGRRLRKAASSLSSALTSSTWLRAYITFGVGLSLLAVALTFICPGCDGIKISFSFDHWKAASYVQLNLDYFSATLIANLPQLILSSCYFSYNSLLTRLHVEKEWNAFGSEHKPLRVSAPKGEQISTYRLQLPYAYSVPLIITSAILHWIASSAVFLWVVEGGFFSYEENWNYQLQEVFHVSEDSIISVGYSTGYVILLLVACVVLIMMPPVIFGHMKPKYRMTSGGVSSLVISAACHPSARAQTKQENYLPEYRSETNDDENCGQSLVSHADVEEGSEPDLPLAQRKLRWGVIEPPPSIADRVASDGCHEILHLGFGSVEDDVREPKDDEYYA
ncbi:hypothetical protein GGS20DRAFT_584072 [Poronia punctata]|nr:hypothetical protein GGS20DRAFT_584072 [Poronia punctata]